MRKLCLGFIFSLLNLSILQTSIAFEQVSIADSQTRTLQSEIVDQEYQLLIHLPGGYAQSNKTYPVIYFLDAQWDFPLMVSTFGQSYYDGFIPEAILVGIQWGGENPDPNVLRARDFTPTTVPEVPNSGGAARFLSFIKRELIPFIKNEYQVNDQRILMGSSYGGLFTLYTLFSEPNLFNGYIPTSSASSWDKGILYAYAKDFDKKKLAQPIRLYSAIGEYDDLMPAFDDLERFFIKLNVSGINTKFERLSGLGHASLKSAGNSWGLHYVFAKPQLALSEAELLEFVGQYQEKESNTYLNVLMEQGQLNVKLDAKSHPLYAASENDFYQIGELFEVSFKPKTQPRKMVIRNFFGVRTFYPVE